MTKRRWRFVTGVAFPQESESTTSRYLTYTAVPFFVIPQTLHHTTACHQPWLSHRKANPPPPGTSPIPPFPFFVIPQTLHHTTACHQPRLSRRKANLPPLLIPHSPLPTASFSPENKSVTFIFCDDGIKTPYHTPFIIPPITKNRRRSLNCSPSRGQRKNI